MLTNNRNDLGRRVNKFDILTCVIRFMFYRLFYSQDNNFELEPVYLQLHFSLDATTSCKQNPEIVQRIYVAVNGAIGRRLTAQSVVETARR